MTETKTKEAPKKRKPSSRVYYVEQIDNTDGTVSVIGDQEVLDTEAGKKWIREHGVDGGSYRIVAETFRTTVEAVVTTKRVLR